MSRPTITWKNQLSSDITGLLIQELPPITRPDMRYDTTEIDGLPGAIIDEQGYDAYKKKLKIGTYGAADIDQIAKYFTGTGKLTTSDEPTRYYNASCLTGIDFEKLIRFREADVVFIVQPYKYLLNEADVALDITDEEELEVTNQGLEESLPAIRLEGSGTIALTINGLEAFSYTFPDADTYVIIDSTQQDAYITGALKNGNMTGEFPFLDSGDNIIGWTGDLTRIVVTPNSRWL